MWKASLVIAVVTFGLWLIWRKRKFSVFKKLGIPGPEPNIFLGNLWEMMKEGPLESHKRWMERYGRIVGYYYGTHPILLVTDVEILRKILISEFQKFVNRPSLFRLGDSKPKEREGFAMHLVYLRDQRWKDIRRILTPTFTTSKMKMMAPIVNDAIDALMENIDDLSKEDVQFDIYDLYQKLSMDVIGRTAFGIHTEVQRGANAGLLRAAKVLFSGNDYGFFTLLSFSFPELGRTFWNTIGALRLMFRNAGIDPFKELARSVGDVIRARRTDSSNRRNDLLQLMMDAEMSESALKNINADDLTAGSNETRKPAQEEFSGASKQTPKNLRQMTDKEILDNAILFFLAGFETTSTALAFVTNFLVRFPDVQERVRKEVHELVAKEGEVTYPSVQKLQYLDQVFSESLRMNPPVHLFVSREIGEDVEFGNIKFKKGFTVQVPVYSLHRDPELWPDPESFDPERFSPENRSKIHSMAWQPFGAGPRNCVGMRFAQMEAKLALAKILEKYRLLPFGETHKKPLALRFTNVFTRPAEGVMVKAILC